MQFTTEQLEALRSGESLRINQEGTYLVVLRADLFERLSRRLFDASLWTNEEMDLLAAEDADALGWEGMETYQGDDQ